MGSSSGWGFCIGRVGKADFRGLHGSKGGRGRRGSVAWGPSPARKHGCSGAAGHVSDDATHARQNRQETHSVTGGARRSGGHGVIREHAARSSAPALQAQEDHACLGIVSMLAEMRAERHRCERSRPRHAQPVQEQQRVEGELRPFRVSPGLPNLGNAVPGRRTGASCAKANSCGCPGEHASGPRATQTHYRTARSPQRRAPASQECVRDGGERARGLV